jgi:hypothetical protein
MAGQDLRVHWFDAQSYWLARLVLQRGIAALYMVGFVCAAMQFRALLGSAGLLPAPRFLARVPFSRAPSLFHWRYSDPLAMGVCWIGAATAVLLVAGVPQWVRRGRRWSPSW